MADNTRVAEIYQASSKLAKYPFEPYWPAAKLKICITGAGGFIARQVARVCVRSAFHGRSSVCTCGERRACMVPWCERDPLVPCR